MWVLARRLLRSGVGLPTADFRDQLPSSMRLANPLLGGPILTTTSSGHVELRREAEQSDEQSREECKAAANIQRLRVSEKAGRSDCVNCACHFQPFEFLSGPGMIIIAPDENGIPVQVGKNGFEFGCSLVLIELPGLQRDGLHLLSEFRREP